MTGDEVRMVEIDYMLEVYCDHAGRVIEPVPERVVTRIIHVPNQRKALGFIEWREALLDDGSDPGCLQTYFGEAVRVGNFGRRNRDGSHVAPGDLVPGMTGSLRWRFACEDCDETIPRKHAKVEPFLDRARHADVQRICLRDLARYTL